jgi:hypothetical protein
MALVLRCLAAGLWGGFFLQACEARVAVSSHAADSARAEGESLPRMRATHISDPEPGPIEHVKGYRIFQAGDCTVWRFQDSVGIHYLAEGRNTSFSPANHAQNALACSVAR